MSSVVNGRSLLGRRNKNGGESLIEQTKMQTYEKVIKYMNREPMRKNTFFTEELKAYNIKGWSE